MARSRTARLALLSALPTIPVAAQYSTTAVRLAWSSRVPITGELDAQRRPIVFGGEVALGNITPMRTFSQSKLFQSSLPGGCAFRGPAPAATRRSDPASAPSGGSRPSRVRPGLADAVRAAPPLPRR